MLQTEIEKRVDTMLEVHEGWVVGMVNKFGAYSSYLIRCRTGTGVVRGMEFKMSAEGEVYVIDAKMMFYSGETGREVESRRDKFAPGDLWMITTIDTHVIRPPLAAP